MPTDDATTALLDPAAPDDGDLFVGSEHGGLALTTVVVGARARKPTARRHPYPTVYVVGAGEATFHVGDETVIAGPGRLVVAPPHTPHRYVSTGRGELRMTAIHTASDRDAAAWLESGW